MIREAQKFPEFYAAYTPIQYYDWLPPGQSNTPLKADPDASAGTSWSGNVSAPITYKGQAAISQDIDNFKSALEGVNVAGAFMPVAAPMSARGLWLNAYYKTDEEIVVALADALKEEYKAIVDAGFILQLDDAFLAHEYDRLRGEMSEREVHKYAERCVDLTNYALTGIPEDKVRYHVCWGSWNAPHTTDVPLRTISDLILKVRAQAYSLESANPRHEHEWMVWKDVKLPEGKILIPGIVTHSTNVVEHPELVAWRIKNFASVVGRENVIAGTDCGFAQSYNIVRCHPSVQWAKLESLAEGAAPSFQGVVGETQGKASESREKARCRPQGWAKVTDPQQADGRVTILSSSRRVSSNGHLVHHLSMQRDQATHVLMGRSASNATFSRNAKIWEMAFVGSTERKKKRPRHV